MGGEIDKGADAPMNREIAKVVSISVRLKAIAMSRATPEGEDEANVAPKSNREEAAVLPEMKSEVRGGPCGWSYFSRRTSTSDMQ